MKKVKFFPLYGKNKKKIYFLSVNTKNISSHMLKISAISLVLRTREISDIFNTFDEIFMVFTEKRKYPLFTGAKSAGRYVIETMKVLKAFFPFKAVKRIT